MRCIMCNHVAEVVRVPALQLEDGRVFVEGFEPLGSKIVSHVGTRRVRCGCDDGREFPYRHP